MRVFKTMVMAAAAFGICRAKTFRSSTARAATRSTRVCRRKRKPRAITPRRARWSLRPWHWREKFPMVNRIDRDQRDAMIAKYKDVLPFPRM